MSIDELWGVTFIEKEMSTQDKPKRIFCVAPDDWTVKTRIPMIVCDKSDALVASADGIYLKCANEDDIAKVKESFNDPYSSISGRYVGDDSEVN